MTGRPKGARGFGWRAFFAASATPVFVLGKGRRLRYANPAWETLTGHPLADSLGLVCSRRRLSTSLAAALAPTDDALAGRVDHARRPALPLKTGPPWWDLTFIPLAGPDGPYGIVGFVAVVGERVTAAGRNVPAGVMTARDRHARQFPLDLWAGRVADQLRVAASTTAPVWLVGEPGTGKETAARAVHYAGPNRERMFVGVDCGGLPPATVEGLFWGVGGLAGSDRVGTVYLKDPGALPRDLQQRLADLLTDEAAPRAICGATRTAAEEVAAGRLTSVYYTKLAVQEIRLPPLRDRLPELPRLAAHLLGGPVALDPAAVDVLTAQPWPANLRELAGVLAEAVTAAGGGPVRRDHLPHALRVRAGLEPPPPEPLLLLEPALEALERRYIRAALARTDGNVTRAADLLGLNRNKLLRRMEALGINP